MRYSPKNQHSSLLKGNPTQGKAYSRQGLLKTMGLLNAMGLLKTMVLLKAMGILKTMGLLKAMGILKTIYITC